MDTIIIIPGISGKVNTDERFLKIKKELENNYNIISFNLWPTTKDVLSLTLENIYDALEKIINENTIIIAKSFGAGILLTKKFKAKKLILLGPTIGIGENNRETIKNKQLKDIEKIEDIKTDKDTLLFYKKNALIIQGDMDTIANKELLNYYKHFILENQDHSLNDIKKVIETIKKNIN